MIKRLTNHNRHRSGQVLLIIIMLLSMTSVVMLSVVFTAQTETKTTKLEEDSKRAFAAAESILEASLKKDAGTYVLNTAGLDISNLNSSFTGSATVTETSGTIFKTPLIQKDQQYTLYLSDYPGYASPYSGNIYVYFKSESSNNCDVVSGDTPVLEFVYFKDDNTISRDLVDPGDKVDKNPGTTLATVNSATLDGTTFRCRLSNPKNIDGHVRFMIIRVLYNSTKIGIEGASSLPSQGRITSAQAETNDTHVSSVMQLFQSYPQIPGDFLVTTF